MTYEDLVALKAEAISEMDFETAKLIETAFRTKKVDDVSDLLTKEKDNLDKELEKEHKKYCTNCEAVQQAGRVFAGKHDADAERVLEQHDAGYGGPFLDR